MRRRKNRAAMILTLAASVIFTACSGSSPAESVVGTSEMTASQGENSAAFETSKDGKILIAYFSVMETDGVNTVSGASRVAVNGDVMGNNEYIADLIGKETVDFPEL